MAAGRLHAPGQRPPQHPSRCAGTPHVCMYVSAERLFWASSARTASHIACWSRHSDVCAVVRTESNSVCMYVLGGCTFMPRQASEDTQMNSTGRGDHRNIVCMYAPTASRTSLPAHLAAGGRRVRGHRGVVGPCSNPRGKAVYGGLDYCFAARFPLGTGHWPCRVLHLLSLGFRMEQRPSLHVSNSSKCAEIAAPQGCVAFPPCIT